jgi:hypothetical protein
MLTDCVFWFIIFPFLTVKDYNLNFVSTHVSSLPQQGHLTLSQKSALIVR